MKKEKKRKSETLERRNGRSKTNWIDRWVYEGRRKRRSESFDSEFPPVVFIPRRNEIKRRGRSAKSFSLFNNFLIIISEQTVRRSTISERFTRNA